MLRFRLQVSKTLAGNMQIVTPKRGAFFPTIFRFGGKIAVALGSGVTATRHALDVKFEVQVLTPQLKRPSARGSFIFFA